MKAKTISKPIGRPRAFDTEAALDRALNLFWEKGYEGTSLSDLTQAIGVNRPSLYAAFGNKEDLFRKVLNRYAERHQGYACKALELPTAREVVEKLLYGSADIQTLPRHPHGCLTVQGGLACGAEAGSIQRELACQRTANQNVLRKRLERAKAEGDLPSDADPADLARYVMTVIQGMAVQAASGASRKELYRIVETALRMWPK
jgi:AcrR family transcriptional regulator